MQPLKILFLLAVSLLSFFPLTSSQVIWNKPSDWNEGLPSSISVFQTNSSFTPGLNMTAAYSKIDLSDPDLELKVVHSEGANLKTPLDYIKDEPNLVYVAMNGGYFDMVHNISISLVISDSTVIAGGLTVLDETFHGRGIPYYPTRGAFGIYENGTAEIMWTYAIDGASDVYAYPEASPNCYNCAPQFVPSNGFPAGGKQWNVTQAVGAGPMIMKDGEVNVNDTASYELFYAPNTDARNPRTGICITQDNQIIFIVVDGRYELSGGLYILELGNLVAELGCKDALNLDGGGSTAMIVNGFVTNRPSDPKGMRPVTSALLVVSKTKPNPHYGGHDWHKVTKEGGKGDNAFDWDVEIDDILQI